MKTIRITLTVFSAIAVTGCTQVTEIAERFTAGESASDTAPFIYLATYKYDGTLSVCLSNAEDALRNNGFTENYARDRKDEYGRVSADNPKGLIAASIECDANIGSTAFAVSSQNNDAAYDSYKKLNDAKW